MLNYPGDIDIGLGFTLKMMESKRWWVRALAIVIDLVYLVWLVGLFFGMGLCFWIIGQSLK